MRPHVAVNCAMSADGKIATAARKQTKLSGEKDAARVHRLRAECDAVLVGIGTVLEDDPKLTVKWELAALSPREQPLRVILDTRGRTPDTAAALQQPGKTLIATGGACTKTWGVAEAFRAGKDRVDLVAVLEELSRRGVKRLLVEGGSEVIWSFLRARLVDELKVFVASTVLGGSAAPTFAGGEGVSDLASAVHLRLEIVTTMDGGVLLEYKVVR